MIVTLTTDFGTADGYVAALRGAMLCRAADLRFVDVTHDVAAQDIMEAAYILQQAAPFFPDDTVHVVVVDPGVGTERLPIAARFSYGGKTQYFVGPDNGILSLFLSGEEPLAAVVLDNPTMWRVPEPSPTFHGRDLFGPVAASLASGEPLESMGSPLLQIQRLLWPLPRIDEQGIDGMVLHIDRYGNCLTNIPRSALNSFGDHQKTKCYVGSTVLRGIQTTYGSVPMGEPLLLFGSNDNLEIAVNGGDAAALLSVTRGASVNLVFAVESAPRKFGPEEHAGYV